MYLVTYNDTRQRCENKHYKIRTHAHTWNWGLSTYKIQYFSHEIKSSERFMCTIIFNYITYIICL